MSNAFSSQAKETYQLSEEFYESACRYLDRGDVVDACDQLRKNRYDWKTIIEICEDNLLYVEDEWCGPELMAISDCLFTELQDIIEEALRTSHGPVAITDREDYRLDGYDHDNFEEMVTGSVILYNLTSRRIILDDMVGAKPIGEGIPELNEFYIGKNLRDYYRRYDQNPQSHDFSFEELPKANKGRCLMVTPEVAIQGVEEDRPDLVAPMNDCIRFINLTDSPVKVTMAYGFPEDSITMRIAGEFDPAPGYHPYLIRPVRDADSLENWGFNLIAHLPPEQEDCLLLVSWPIALVGHAMGRTDLIGVPATAL